MRKFFIRVYQIVHYHYSFSFLVSFSNFFLSFFFPFYFKTDFDHGCTLYIGASDSLLKYASTRETRKSPMFFLLSLFFLLFFIPFPHLFSSFFLSLPYIHIPLLWWWLLQATVTPTPWINCFRLVYARSRRVFCDIF